MACSRSAVDQEGLFEMSAEFLITSLVVILLPGTSIHLTNNRRSLETRHFNSPATRARIERRGRDVAIVLEMRTNATPRVRSESGSHGYHYIFIEFAPGQYDG